MGFEKVFENGFRFWKSFWKSIAQTGSHWAYQFVCLWFWQTGASSDYYKRDRTRNLKTVVQRLLSVKSLKKGPRNALRLLREQDGFDIKRHCLSTGLRMRLKA